MSQSSGTFLANLRAEAPVIAGAATTAVFFTVGKDWTSDFSQPVLIAALFVWLFAAMIWCAFGVVRHAEVLAEYLGEPYGTLILTIAVISTSRWPSWPPSCCTAAPTRRCRATPSSPC